MPRTPVRPRAALAALALALTACGADPTTPSTDPTTPAPSPSSTTPAPTFASPSPSPSPSPSAVAKTGSATVTYRGRTFRYAERACQTTRGMDGSVVGWMATFQDATAQAKRYQTGITDSESYVVIRLRGYTGAGSYPSGRVSVRLGDEDGDQAYGTGFGVVGQSLVLRDGGRAGTYKSKDLTVELTCDPTDDTGTTAGSPVVDPPAPGTAYVVRPEGAVFTFQGVRCDKAGSDNRIVAGAFPHFFRVLTGAAEGRQAGGRVLFGVHGVVVPFTGSGVRVDVSGDPVSSGSFRYSPSGPNATTDVTRGAFACG